MTMRICEITTPSESSDAHLNRIREIIQMLKTDQSFTSYREKIMVFGSIVMGKTYPGDVDIFIDFTENQTGATALLS